MYTLQLWDCSWISSEKQVIGTRVFFSPLIKNRSIRNSWLMCLSVAHHVISFQPTKHHAGSSLQYRLCPII